MAKFLPAIATSFALLSGEFLFGALLPSAAHATDLPLRGDIIHLAVVNPARNPAFVARDGSRHPEEELKFFGLKPFMTVVEIWPSQGYWTQILGPILRKRGTYYIALPPEGETDVLRQELGDTKNDGPIHLTNLGPQKSDIAPPGSADMVLTFRNLHNWLKAGYAPQAFDEIYKALKPGGVLGIEDHRGLESLSQDKQTASGYVQESFTIDLAKKAGFEFVASSPINDNPKDKKQWARGVWTLPPTLAMGDTNRAYYRAIGEADNYVLLFKKPAKR
jgi:predicted methyltransferase